MASRKIATLTLWIYANRPASQPNIVSYIASPTHPPTPYKSERRNLSIIFFLLHIASVEELSETEKHLLKINANNSRPLMGSDAAVI